MSHQYQDLIKRAYAAFNARDIDGVFLSMHPNVHWPNGWEGGYVEGQDEVREYWTRQWKELDPNVEPVDFKEKQNNKVEVTVHQVVKDRDGKVLFDGIVKHVYTIEKDLIKSMEIEKV